MSESLMARIARGEDAAVAEVIDQYGALVWSIARRLTRNPSDAEDAVQEIFTDVWRSAHRFDASAGTEKVFVTTIARRRLIDRMRRLSNRVQTDSTDVLDELGFHTPDTAGEVSVEAERAARVLATLAPRAAPGHRARAAAGPVALGDRGRHGHAARHREDLHAPRAHPGARDARRHARRGCRRRGMNARFLEDERLADLLVLEVTEGLEPAERQELEALLAAAPGATPDALAGAAAAVTLAARLPPSRCRPSCARRSSSRARPWCG
jgi:RNA polymerase sigma factor (sigma-70 family)